MKRIVSMVFAAVVLAAGTAQAQTFFWTNAVNTTAATNWNTDNSWSNGAPSSGGSRDYTIVMLTPGANTTNFNNLGVGGTTNGFLLNSLIISNQGSGYDVISGSNLVFISNSSGVTPILNVGPTSGNYNWTINNNIVLSNSLTITGGNSANSTTRTLNGIISGVGDITNNSLNGKALAVTSTANTFTGTWVLDGGGVQFTANDGTFGNAANGVVLKNGGTLQLSASLTWGAARILTIGPGDGIISMQSTGRTLTLTNITSLAGSGRLVLGDRGNLAINTNQANFTGSVIVGLNGVNGSSTLTFGGNGSLSNATSIVVTNYGIVAVGNPWAYGSGTITNLANSQATLTMTPGAGRTKFFLNDLAAVSSTDVRLNALTIGDSLTLASGAVPILIHTDANGTGIPSGLNPNQAVYGLGVNMITNAMTIGDAVSTQWKGLGVGVGASFGLGTNASGNQISLNGNAELDALAGGTLTITNQITGGNAANTLAIRGNGTVVLLNTNNNFADLISGAGGTILYGGHTAGVQTLSFAAGSNSFAKVGMLTTGTGVLVLQQGAGASSNYVSGGLVAATGTTLRVDSGYWQQSVVLVPGYNSSLMINGGTVIAPNGGRHFNSSNLTINAGTLIISGSDRFALEYDAQTLNINGGTLIVSNTLYNEHLGNDANPGQSGGGVAATALQTGGTNLVYGGTTYGALEMGGTTGTAGKNIVYDLQGGALLLPTPNANNPALYLGADVGGLSTTKFILNTNGLLQVNGDIRGAQGTGAKQIFAFNGGTLQALSINITVGVNLTNLVQSLGAVIDSTSNTVTISSALYEDPSSTGGGLTKLGSGTLLLTATNYYTGGTTLSNGTVSISSYSNLPAAGGLNFNGGTLQITGTAITNLNAYAINWNSGGLDVTNAANILTVTNSLGGAGSLTKLGAGTLVLSGVNTYNGGTFIQGGVLNVSNETALGAAGGGLTLTNASILQTSRDMTLNNRELLVLTGGGTFNTDTGTTLTGTNALTASGLLTKTGAGTFTWANNNVAISGGLQINGGTLFMNNSVLTNTTAANEYLGVAVGDSGTLTLAGTSKFVKTTANELIFGQSGTGSLNVQGSALLSLAGNLRLADNLGSTGMVYQTGGTISAAVVYVGDAGYGLYQHQAGSLTDNSGNLIVGNVSGSLGLFYQHGGTVNTISSLILGYSAGSVGAWYQTNGAVNVGYDLYVANSGYGYYQMAGGSLTNARYLRTGSGLGLFYQTAGTITNTSAVDGEGLLIGSGGTGVVYMTGGTYAGSSVWNLGYSASSGRSELTIADNANVDINSYLRMNATSGGTTTNIFNLNGGIFEINALYKQYVGGYSVLNLNGGRFVAGASSSTLGVGGVGALNAAYVWNGGAIFDTQSNSLTITQPLLAPVGSGVVISVSSLIRSNYVGAPYVNISGGGGVGATAVAQFDYTQGTVTGIVVTSAGVGYTTPPTVTLVGGGNTDYSLPSGISLVANTGGGLTKYGTGTLYLAATNSYSGGTFVGSGILEAVHTGAVPQVFSSALTVSNGAVFAALASGAAGNWQSADIDTVRGSANFLAGSALGIDVSTGSNFTYASNLGDTGAGALGFVKLGGGLLTLSGNNTYSGGTILNGGKLYITNDLNLGLVPVTVATNITFSGNSTLQAGADLTFTANRTILIANGATATNDTQGHTVTINGVITGGGSFSKMGSGLLSITNATLGGDLRVGYYDDISPGSNVLAVQNYSSVSIGSGNANTLDVGIWGNYVTNTDAILDLRLATNVNVNVGTVRVGMQPSTGGSGVSPKNAYLKLPGTSAITAATSFVVGDSIGGQNMTGTVTITGSGITTIRTPLMTIGGNKASGLLILGAGSTLDLAGTNAGRTALSVGNWQGYQSGGNYSGTADFSAGTFSASLNSLQIGVVNHYMGGAEVGTMTLGTSAANHLDISGVANGVGVVIIGRTLTNASTGAMPRQGTLTISNLDMTSSLTVTDNGTAILLGSRGPGVDTTSNNITGTLNLLGGTLTITTTGSAIAGGSGTSVVNLANTTLKAGASSTAWITGLTTANIAGSGVTFDTAGYDITIPQSFSGTGAVTKVGAGMLLLSGASSYSGGTLLSVGTLVANASTALGSGLLTMNGGVLSNSASSTLANNINLSSPGTIGVAGGQTLGLVGALTNSGTLTKTGEGTLLLSGVSTYSGGTLVNAGTLKVASGAALSGSTTVYVDNLGIIDFSGNIQTIAGLTGGGVVTNGGGNLTLNLASANTFGGVLKGASTLTLTGGGTLNLTGTNSFSGATLVSNATLVVNGLHNGGVITVYSASRLKGSGTIGAAVTVLAGGTLQAGNSPGLLTFTNGLTLSADSTNVWQLLGNSSGLRGATNGYSAINVTGGDLFITTGSKIQLEFNATDSAVHWTNAFWDSSQTWHFMDVTGGGASTNNYAFSDLVSTWLDVGGQALTDVRPGATFGASLDGSGNVLINYNAIPEPSTASLLGLIGAAWLVRRLRRRRAHV